MRNFGQKQNRSQNPIFSGQRCPTSQSMPELHHRTDLTLHLQRRIENQAVERMLQPYVEEFNAGLIGTVSPRFGHDFSRIPIRSSARGAVQTKRAINAPMDEYEQEADLVAEQVMRMPEPQSQRACVCAGECLKCQTKQPRQDYQALQTRRVQSDKTGEISVLPIIHEVSVAPGQPFDSATRGFMKSRFGHSFDQVRLHTDAEVVESSHAVSALAYTAGQNVVLGAGQYEPHKRVGRQLLAHELSHILQQRSAAADANSQVIQRAVEEPIQTRLSPPQAEKVGAFESTNWLKTQLSNKAGGSPLSNEVRNFMEPHFATDFSQVRVHTDNDAAQMNRVLNAQAFTCRQNIYSGSGKSASKDALTAHELTHVLQQSGGVQPKKAAHVPEVQREVQIRPPGRREASAFNRREELIERLNRQSPAIQYWLDGRVLRYNVIDEAALTNFDRQMRGFIDRAEVVPMRLITSAGFVGGEPLLVDSLMLAYVDLDDMLSSDDLSFQLNLIHFLTERFGVRNYERRIGTNMPEFDRAHRAGLEAEVNHLRSVIGDPTIRFIFERTRPNGAVVFVFRSAEGYRVIHVFPGGARRAARGGEVFVLTRDRRRLTIHQFIAERTAAARAPALP